MAFQPQVILVPATLQTIGPWVNATFKYQQAFRGVHVSHDPSPANLRRFSVITVVGSAAQWGRDILSEVRHAAPHATLDAISAPDPAALRRELDERAAAGHRLGQASTAQGLQMRWPTDYPKVTQPFRARPEYYRQFQCEGQPLPGHEGIDIRAPVIGGQGSRIYACADGVVYTVHQTDDDQPYGARVRINHTAGGATYQTAYAHLTERSITVKAGDPVAAGQLIALSGNTGNSGGAHLHLTLKRFGATDARETDYPCDLIDPTPYLYWPNLRLTPIEPLNIRAEPTTDSAKRGLAMPGEELTPMSAHAVVLWDIWQPSGWVRVRTAAGLEGYCFAAYLQVVGVEPEIPPLPMGRFVAGLHGRADGAMQAADFRAVEVSRVEAVKLTTNASAADVAHLRQLNRDIFITARLFEDFRTPGGQPRAISARVFAEKFRPNPAGQQPTDFQRLYEQGIRYVEVHNEPNLTTEGFGPGGSWNSGAEFSAWFLEVIDRLRAWFPDALWGFPGLSPGAAIPSVRPQEMWDFLAQCAPAIAASDWLGVHQYFANTTEMKDGLEKIVRAYRRHWPDKLLMITEFSNPIKTVSKATKGQQYVAYYQMLEEIPGVGAAFAYVVSASDPAFQSETWREENGAITPIVAAVGARQVVAAD